jgi:hypothetical protein
MTNETKDSALAFVGQIMTAYRAAMKVEGDALRAAIECGKYLNLAKENVKAANGKWEAWRKKNCPEISQQTASLYMRLAENKDEIGGAKTIREADMMLRKPRDDEDDQDETDDDAEDTGDETNNALLVEPQPASPDLVALLKNVGADEVVTALHQAGWDAEKVKKLVSLLTASLQPIASAPVRRSLSQSQASLSN